MTKNQHGGILSFVLTQSLSRKPDSGPVTDRGYKRIDLRWMVIGEPSTMNADRGGLSNVSTNSSP